MMIDRCRPMKTVFERERSGEICLVKPGNEHEMFTEQVIQHLPEPIKKYLRVCGYINEPIMYNADVVWEECFIKLKPGKEWSRLETRQYNSVQPLARFAYMKFLSMPVAGRDSYHNGIGEMKGKLFNLFPIINGRGKEVSQSSLITIFCEFLFIPGYILQDYVKWESVDTKTARATLYDKEFIVSGIFHFDNEGFFLRFETEDRYYTDEKGKYTMTRFSAIVDSYQTIDEILIPQNVTVVWHLPAGDYEYFMGTIKNINFNVNH